MWDFSEFVPIIITAIAIIVVMWAQRPSKPAAQPAGRHVSKLLSAPRGPPRQVEASGSRSKNESSENKRYFRNGKQRGPDTGKRQCVRKPQINFTWIVATSVEAPKALSDRPKGFPAGEVVDLQSEDMVREALQSFKGVIVDFYATWCGPCRRIGPMFETMARSYAENANLLFCKVDVDKLSSIAKSSNVTSMPTFQFLLNGKRKDQMVGGDPKKLQDKVTEWAAQVPHKAPVKEQQWASKVAVFEPKRLELYRGGQIGKIQSKILEFSGKLTRPLSLTPEEQTKLDTLIQTIGNQSFYHASSLSQAQLDLLSSLLQCWPVEYCFPVLDLVRMAVLHPSFVSALVLGKHALHRDVLCFVGQDAVSEQLLLKTMVNLFADPRCWNSLVLSRELVDLCERLILSPEQKTADVAARFISNAAHTVCRMCEDSGHTATLESWLTRGTKLLYQKLRPPHQLLVINAVGVMVTALCVAKECIIGWSILACQGTLAATEDAMRRAQEAQENELLATVSMLVDLLKEVQQIANGPNRKPMPNPWA